MTMKMPNDRKARPCAAWTTRHVPRPATARHAKAAEEGGCGVTGLMCSVPVRGRHIYEPSIQMHNRGNGKGGGIAAVGLCAEDLGVSRQVLDSHYMLQVALLDPAARAEVEKRNITPFLDVHQSGKIPCVDDYRDIEGLDVKPPDVWRYFVRVKPGVLERFAAQNGLDRWGADKVEDEFIYRNSSDLNQRFYASLGKQRAFVLSHGRNLMILKIVGYAEKVVEYYQMADFRAHGWIAHQRYPTKGRVWHPGGAHPFSGLNEALVHNGDFANYHAVCEYLQQYNIAPQFLTDTEVAILLFDLYNRLFAYPMEYIIEALAPTGEYDFELLDRERRRIYRALQSAHIHASPDGPWFFIIARNDPAEKIFQLMGITDTSMLRPQVFALQQGEVQIGLVCSEKQAIDATLQSLAAEDDRFCPVADKYWNARGGSASDGGAFMFTVGHGNTAADGGELVCTNKFGEHITISGARRHVRPSAMAARKPQSTNAAGVGQWIQARLEDDPADLAAACRRRMAVWDFSDVAVLCDALMDGAGRSAAVLTTAVDVLTALHDQRYPTGDKKRSGLLAMFQQALARIFRSVPLLAQPGESHWRRVDWRHRHHLRPPGGKETVLVVDVAGFPPEGDDGHARLICRAYESGWRRFVCFGYKGQRFTGCGLSTDSRGVRIDVYDSSGDYLASGIDGLEIVVHGNGQDQLGQIMKSGRLVVHGDVGQTFMYGAKGGTVYVLGNAAGRPLINAVGSPRVVINGTCLDYLAESFMAGDPLKGGGFVIVNGLEFDDDGGAVPQTTPYPGSNLFSLASGGAIYLRDPDKMVVAAQLNGGVFFDLDEADWRLIRPYLEENERLFGISIEKDLLTVNGRVRPFHEVYRKVKAVKLDVLANASAGYEEWQADWRSEVP